MRSHAKAAYLNANGPGVFSTALWSANMAAWARWTLRAEEAEAKLAALLALKDK